MEKRILIQTNFTENDPAYSLCNVVSDQIKMLIMHGYIANVTVADGFERTGIFEDEEHVKLRYIPRVACHNEVRKDESFDQDVDALTEAFDDACKDIDVVLSHDLIYQPGSLKHNIACRRIAEKYPKILWYHWIHSATSPFTITQLRPIFQDIYVDLISKKFPNSHPVFFNEFSRRRIAKNFGYEEQEVRIVHHPTDICGRMGMSELLEKFVTQNDILSKDIICVYPIRLDRGKQVEVMFKTLACLKEKGYTVAAIVVDFHSNSKNDQDDKYKYREELKNIAIDWKLGEGDYYFTSEQNQEWDLRINHASVQQLMTLSNVFIMPSVSESYSLVTQEASLFGKCIIVLNQDFPPFRDIFGSSAIFRQYSSRINVLSGTDGSTDTKYDQGEHVYHMETANIISYHLENDYSLAMSTRLRKLRNLHTVFEKEIEPLFFA